MSWVRETNLPTTPLESHLDLVTVSVTVTHKESAVLQRYKQMIGEKSPITSTHSRWLKAIS